jgi:AcrR family transcriptional regulator
MGNREKTMDQLRKTALDLFSRKGFHGVATSDVARKARRNESLLFRYFGDKRGLLQDVVDHYQLPRDEPPFDDPDSYSVGDFFRVLTDGWFRTYVARPEYFRVVRYCLLEDPKLLKGYLKDYRENRIIPVLTYISQRQLSGEIRDDVSPLTLVIGFAGGLTSWVELKIWLPIAGNDGWDRFQEEWLRVFLDSIRVPAGSPRGA